MASEFENCPHCGASQQAWAETLGGYCCEYTEALADPDGIGAAFGVLKTLRQHGFPVFTDRDLLTPELARLIKGSG